MLRGTSAVALAGLTLAVYDYASELISLLLECQDGHAREVRTLGYPRAALLALTLAVMAYNCLACVRGTLASAQGQEQVESHLSAYYVALEVKTASDGMQVAVPAQEWAPWENLAHKRLPHVLRTTASHARFRRYPQHPAVVRKTEFQGRRLPARPMFPLAAFYNSPSCPESRPQ